MNLSRIFPLLFALWLPHAIADNTYGYIAFWYNPTEANSVPQTKTTRENNTQADAETEIQQFCAQYNQQLPDGTTGCFGVTALQNTCAAAAWSHKRGLMRPDNVYIAQHHDFRKVGKLAKKMCRQDNGWFARCEVETVYCTDHAQYQAR